jgi:hypothetical protein
MNPKALVFDYQDKLDKMQRNSEAARHNIVAFMVD